MRIQILIVGFKGLITSRAKAKLFMQGLIGMAVTIPQFGCIRSLRTFFRKFSTDLLGLLTVNFGKCDDGEVRIMTLAFFFEEICLACLANLVV